MRAVKPFCHQSSRNGSRHKGRKNYNRLKIHISTMLQQDGDNTIVTFVTGQYQREPPFLRYRRSERRRSSKRKDILTELIPLMSLARPFSIISLTLLSSLALIAEWRGKEEAIQDFQGIAFFCDKKMLFFATHNPACVVLGFRLVIGVKMDCVTMVLVERETGLPLDLVVLINSFLYERLTDENFKQAIALWFRNKKECKFRFGHISDWKTSRVTNMERAFYKRSDFNENIGQWDVSSVTYMRGML
jgi:hypothetical protein